MRAPAATEPAPRCLRRCTGPALQVRERGSPRCIVSWRVVWWVRARARASASASASARARARAMAMATPGLCRCDDAAARASLLETSHHRRHCLTAALGSTGPDDAGAINHRTHARRHHRRHHLRHRHRHRLRLRLRVRLRAPRSLSPLECSPSPPARQPNTHPPASTRFPAAACTTAAAIPSNKDAPEQRRDTSVQSWQRANGVSQPALLPCFLVCAAVVCAFPARLAFPATIAPAGLT